jgi:hypothetical protein
MNERASRGALLMMTLRGDGLVTVVLSDVDDVIPHVKAIYAVLDKRMGHE